MKKEKTTTATATMTVLTHSMTFFYIMKTAAAAENDLQYAKSSNNYINR